MNYDMIFPISKKIYTWGTYQPNQQSIDIRIIEGIIVGYVHDDIEITGVRIRIQNEDGRVCERNLDWIADSIEDAKNMVGYKRKL